MIVKNNTSLFETWPSSCTCSGMLLMWWWKFTLII